MTSNIEYKDIREQIKAYSTRGGSWNHLSKRLIEFGFSKGFAATFIDYARKELSSKHSESVLEGFDLWDENRTDRENRLRMLMAGKALN